jgi:hypothetical protein
VLHEGGHDGDKLGGFSFLLSLEVLKGMRIIYSVIVNLHIVISWVWLPQSGFSLEVLKRFSTLLTKSCVVIVLIFFIFVLVYF